MTTDEMRIAVAESLGWVWYRHPTANSLHNKHYRFLALPAAHELEQSPQWMVRADMTEKPCVMGYIVSEFHLPNYSADLNAIREVILREAEISGFAFQADYQLKLQLVVERRRRDLNREQIGWWMNNATASECCEAYLTVKGLLK